MLRRGTIVVAAFALLVSAAGLAQATTFNVNNYTITNVGGVDANYSGPVALNFRGYNLTDSGLVTGQGIYGYRGSGFPTTPTTYLGEWTAGGGFVPLYNTGDSGFGYYPAAMGNDSGTFSFWTEFGSSNGHLWTSSGGVTSPAALSSGAGLINSSGLAAGGDWLNATTGCAYDTVTHVGYTLPGVGMNINNAGQVCGSENNFGTGFVWTENASTYWGAANTTTTLSGFAEAECLSPNGRYVGGTGPGYSNAIVYDANTHSYSTVASGEVYAIASNGWMGGDTDGTGDFGGTAWLWDGTTLHNLNTELTAKFPSVLSGLTVCACMAINSSNQILVWGTNSTQYPETFVLTPVPEPSALLLLASGLAGLLAYAWRKRK